ncbi:MAG: hypothetical protein JW908_10770 [Anaerolineales bacterium]|nr:hypothetical protein [Anaerolineales bacterium]
MIAAFLIDFFLKTLIYFAIMWVTGWLVENKNVKVNYTRKINHFALLIVPYLLNVLLRKPPSADNDTSSIWMQVIALLSGLLFFLIFINPIRSRNKIIKTAFKGIDRPEDRPLTLLWMTTQTAGNFLASIPISIYLSSIGKPQLVFILILINGIGDGLAEPIGIRFGKHQYKTNALFTKKTYLRSIEGSLTVFIVSILTILLFASSFSMTQLIFLFALLPISMTITEAKAPHTWDNPLLFLTGSIIIFTITHFF